MADRAREILDLVRGLTAMTPKQLSAVAHLLPPGSVEAVGIAAKLPRSNQGRKRQEALVAKMLRGQLTETQIDKLEEAVELAASNSGLYEDGDVAGMVAAWQEGLLADDQARPAFGYFTSEDCAVVAEVYGYPRDWAPDHQQLRTLVRQCQQALEEEGQRQPSASTAPASLPDDGNGDAGGSGSDAESEADAELAEALAEARARSGSGRKVAEPRSRGLLRSLGRTLRPLAKRVVREGMGDA
ncbi:hypothetical protein GPECTOR_23g64 [Gonium pectorale]|uniref:Uncharacterized protein n=1 Tax=Gonium pectorale TaxID=33097 RepID=A0A150GH29_GONPE|nr:hypothetical protein GPECTOR_23g64 [Gonium pectorale]|eukprot:KXZ49136.1 hypothetical protein GPECTOR_23g64 [Gonium pectorale]